MPNTTDAQRRRRSAAIALLALSSFSLVACSTQPWSPDTTKNQPVAAVSIAPQSEATPPEIRSMTLDNGLKIIVWPDHDIPNVVMQNFVRAGSRNEVAGITGLSHFFEHMMFLGTEKLQPGEFDQTMEAAGGSNNAYTSNDLTVYQDWFPRSALLKIFELEADRLQNLQTYADAVAAEREVVSSERRSSVENDNMSKLYEQVRATAYIAHSYRTPIIGWPSDIEAWTEQDLADFYRSYYAPNNRTMIYTGDITADEVFALAQEYFAPIPAQDPPPEVRTVEPEQPGTRRIVVEADAQTPLLHVAFHAGNATDARTQPLNLLLNILIGGESSRLYRALVEDEQIALDVNGFQDAGFDPGLAYFYLTLPPGGDVAAVEARLLEELQRVANDGVTESELMKARNITLADFWRGLATINGKAAALGQYEVFNGNYELLFELPAELEAINAEQLRTVAADIFRSRNMTVGVLQSPPEVAK